MSRTLQLALALMIVAAVSIEAQAQSVPGCGTLRNAFGPFDYRDPTAKGEPLHLVEIAHFTSDVENLVRGKSGYLIGDIDYTLRAFPNHHRALNAVSRYELRGSKQWANPDIRSARCYFDRAVFFAPTDEVVHMLYANYLTKKGDRAAARQRYEEALRLAPLSTEVNYNAGLFFVSEGDLARARKLAEVAYAGGYPLPGLRKRIQQEERRRGGSASTN